MGYNIRKLYHSSLNQLFRSIPQRRQPLHFSGSISHSTPWKDFHLQCNKASMEDDTRPAAPQAEAEWTYPPRTCRICLEEVPATVTMYPPGLPVQFQTPNVEYKNSDEYGRLIRPCQCRGGMRYIHELCLLQSRVEGDRASAKWQCPTCLHKFSFQRLNAQRILESRTANAGITVVVLVVMMFILGFIADPLINLYFDPYDTIARSDYWQHIDLNEVEDPSGWVGHFTKGFMTLGLVGFLKTLLANPFNWNWRPGGMMGGRVRTGNTGQERVVNVSWIAVAVGVCTAFYVSLSRLQRRAGCSAVALASHSNAGFTTPYTEHLRCKY